MGKHVFKRLTQIGVLAIASTLPACALFRGNVIEPVADAPAPPAPVSAPGYTSVPHPLGLQVGDILALFAAPDSPKREGDDLKGCGTDYRALSAKTKVREELDHGLLELVRKEPVRYHWCFYGMILDLEDRLRHASLLDERQLAVVEAYRFLAPLSRAFYREFHDSRYLRWAIAYYRHASEFAFYRSVETSPALTQELVGVGGDESARGTSEKSSSVLEKYGIVVPERLPPGAPPTESRVGDVLPSDAYVDTGSGVLDAAVPASDRAPAAAKHATDRPINGTPEVFPASAE